MTNNKKFRPAQVTAGIILIGLATWFLIAALVIESTPLEGRIYLLIGAGASLWLGIQGLNKQ